jgi:hypothetical protein
MNHTSTIDIQLMPEQAERVQRIQQQAFVGLDVRVILSSSGEPSFQTKDEFRCNYYACNKRGLPMRRCSYHNYMYCPEYIKEFGEVKSDQNH